MIKSYIALDIETSGLNPSNDKIIEIGMAKVIDGEIVEHYAKLINPECKLNPRIVELTGIDNSMLENAPVISEIIEEIVAFTDNLPILGHNVIFDYSFLKKAAVNSNLKFEKDGIDTLKMARRILPEVEHKNLDYLCAHFGIDPGNSHRAYDDAVSAKLLYDKLYELKPDDNGFEVPVHLKYTVKKDTPITPAQRNYLGKLIKFYNVTLDESIESLTKSKASKIIDGIISEYGKMPYQH